MLMESERGQERRTPIDLFQAVDEPEVRERSALRLLKLPCFRILRESAISCLPDCQWPEFQHLFGRMIHVRIGMVVVVVDRYGGQGIKGLRIGIKKLDGCSECIRKNASASAR